ncbi:MAG: hypothetical protein AB2693_11495 [Candidatus Thiodiazotropha sp.]
MKKQLLHMTELLFELHIVDIIDGIAEGGSKTGSYNGRPGQVKNEETVRKRNGSKV